MYKGYVIKVENLRPHPNADKLQLLDVFGTTTCVSLDVKVGDLGIYFPTDGQLSAEFCDANHLCRKRSDGTTDTGYMDGDKRNVSAIRLRGEKSDGLYLPIECLSYLNVKIDDYKPGDTIDAINGKEICRKYIPRSNKSSSTNRQGNKTRKHIAPIAPLFAEHADTAQLAYNLGEFKAGDEIEITLKMHGTSGRTAHVPTLKGCKRTFWDKICGRAGTPVYEYGYVSGTRRTVMEPGKTGYYGSNEFREKCSEMFEGKLAKGETVYYEIVGYTTDGTPIMPPAANSKTKDKEFIKKYGDTTHFSYGCSPTGRKIVYGQDDVSTFTIEEEVPQFDVYVYRMTMTNEDNFVVEYTPDFMRYRCEQMGIKTVPLFWKGIIDPGVEDAGEIVRQIVEQHYDGPDPIGKTHVREGAVVRIINRPKFTAFKHKNFSFKVLENICKVDAEAPDMEEAEEVNNETDN